MKTIEVVSVFDPGIDRTKTDLAKYAGTERDPASRDMSLVVPLPGRTLTRFSLRALTRNQHDLVDSQPNHPASRNMAIVFGLAAVHLASETRRPTLEVPAEDGGTIQIWSDKGLNDLQDLLGRDVFKEIALAIVNMSPTLGNAFGGSDERIFALPPQWLLEAERSGRRSAV